MKDKASITSLREDLSNAIWKVMHGHDGRLLEGDFYPGHEAIVEAALSAIPDLRTSLLQALEGKQP